MQGDNHVWHDTHACDYLQIVYFVFVNTVQLFSLLSASVFSVSIDPVNNSMAVSGGEDDKAYVWRIQDGETLMECHGIVFLYLSIVTILVLIILRSCLSFKELQGIISQCSEQMVEYKFCSLPSPPPKPSLT